VVPSLGVQARVVEVSGERVAVEAGRVRTWVRTADLAAAPEEPARKPRKPATPPPERAGGSFGGVPTDASSLDLRGRRLEEAKEAIETFLDGCVLRGEPVAYLLHGHGTGALKTGLRRWLPACRYVRRWRPAAEGEGGDAWTVLELV
jgi:DNA mismatch repair protein MutS2